MKNLEKEILRGEELLKSNQIFLGEDELIYPIDVAYGQKDWNTVSSLREFIANVFDANAEYSIEYHNGYAAIKDMGKGLSRQSFVFGKSTKSTEDDSAVGQFGEGIKMAILTLLRLDRKVWIDTVGTTVLPEKSVSNAYNAELMKLRFLPNEQTIGTNIYIECSEEELNEAKSLFLKINGLSRVDNNIYEPEGKIFIVGLQTTKLDNLLFSYNIDDKTMTNRDRNIVETSLLQKNLIEIMREAKNQAFISKYLKSFTTNPGAYEYQLAFLPKTKNISAWKKTLNKLYPKAALSSDVKSDLYATMMGYKVLRNIPLNVLSVLRSLGVKPSSEYAANYKGEGLKQNNKIIFPISEDYVGNWTRNNAIREFIANSLDASENTPRITNDNGVGRISDSGDGIAKKHFLFGVSEKSDTAIGKWGEGLKVACLVLARTGSPVKIETIGYTYEADLEYNEDFGRKLLVINYSKNGRKKGTSISFKCTKDELEDAKALFVQFKGIRKKPISTNSLDVYLSNPGVIFCNGLETAKVNSVFGYNIKDKSVVISRDRNSVDIYSLQMKIRDFLSSTSEEDVIKEFLLKWKDNNSCIEYAINNLVIRNTSKWLTIAKRLYSKACFSTYDDYTSEFIASQAGYTILRSIPECIRQILRMAGVENATKVADKYRNKGILIGDRLVYPITREYNSGFGVHGAITEIISNALDTKTKVSTSIKDGRISITDSGNGISKADLLFSNFNKSKDEIGQFGEGLKLAALALARNNREMLIETKGFTFRVTLERDKSFNADVMVVYIDKNKKKKGTSISFNGTEKELENAKDVFLVLNSDYKEIAPNIYTHKKNPNSEKKRLFVNGVAVTTFNMLFRYNIENKSVVSRDRTTVHNDKAIYEIKRLLENCDNKKVIEVIITNMSTSGLETTIDLQPSSSVVNVWKEVVRKVYKNCCIATGSEYDLVAKDKGMTLLTGYPLSLLNLLMKLGVLPSTQAVSLKGDELQIRKRFDEKKLSPKGAKRWAMALELFAELYGSRLSKKIELVEQFGDNVETDSIWGLYNSTTDKIYILYHLVNDVDKYDFETLIGVLIHEQVHRMSGAHDRTREFENALSMELGKIAVKLFKINTGKRFIA